MLDRERPDRLKRFQDTRSSKELAGLHRVWWQFLLSSLLGWNTSEVLILSQQGQIETLNALQAALILKRRGRSFEAQNFCL